MTTKCFEAHMEVLTKVWYMHHVQDIPYIFINYEVAKLFCLINDTMLSLHNAHGN